MTRRPLAGLTVLEDGNRLAVAACGSVLAAFGAQVSVARSAREYRTAYPAAQADEKRFVAADAAEQLRAQADVVLRSTDVSPCSTAYASPQQICCDITAYGATGPLAGVAHADPLLQAMSGLADTTGEPDAPPALCRFPVLEGIGALYATVGVLTALLARKRIGRGQAVEIALFDCAFSTLATFMPFHFVGKPVTRSGNRHVLASPWNIYRARDAWLVICTGSDEQWLRLCRVLDRPDLADDPRLRRGPDRVLQRAVVDAAVQRWIEGRNAADAAAALEAQGIAAGTVVAVDALTSEPNIRHRRLYGDRGMRSAIRYFDRATGAVASGERTIRDDSSCVEAASTLPLAGLKVIELGQYTTAPFVARHLGAFGADVLKIEPPGGDATRTWPPQHDGLGYFFCLSNSDKRSCCLDLRAAGDRARFGELLRGADVLVENLKPGSLQKLGFDADRRAAINARLVYCAISGFGADSAYPGRPAFDTVIQAMSGIMDSIRQNDRPQKAGISLADILGGLFALAGTLSALFDRAQSGTGDALDVSMQDAAAWITQWSGSAPQSTYTTLRCRDGYVVAMAAADERSATPSFLLGSRAEAVAQLHDQGIQAAAVLSIDEVARSDQARVRRTLVQVRDSNARDWQVFNTPVRLSVTPAAVRRGIGPLGEADTSGGWLVG